MKYFLDLGNGVVVYYYAAIEKASSKNIGINWVPSDATAGSVDADRSDVCNRLVFKFILLDIYTLI